MHFKRNTETYDEIDENLQEVLFHHQEEAKKTFFQFFYSDFRFPEGHFMIHELLSH